MKLSTNITYFYYGKVKKVYQSVVKDLPSGEIVSLEVLSYGNKTIIKFSK